MDKRIAILLTQSNPIGVAATVDFKIDVACELIDMAAGKARLRWSSAYPFQGEEYRVAAEQATAYQADPETGTFAALQADIDASTIDPRTGNPVTDLAGSADLIQFKRELYETALTDIRALRLAAKTDVKTKTTEADIRAAMQINWPSP